MGISVKEADVMVDSWKCCAMGCVVMCYVTEARQMNEGRSGYIGNVINMSLTGPNTVKFQKQLVFSLNGIVLPHSRALEACHGH